jgi:hypothetical protein
MPANRRNVRLPHHPTAAHGHRQRQLTRVIERAPPCSRALRGAAREGFCEMKLLQWRNKWRRLSSLRFSSVVVTFRRLESPRHLFRKTLSRMATVTENPCVFGPEVM